MEDVLLVLVGVVFLFFGYHIMKKLDYFIWEVEKGGGKKHSDNY